MKRELAKEERAQRVFKRAASVLFESWEEDWRHSRLLDVPLIPNDVILAGVSRKGAQHREHVVPLALIRDHCEKLFENGADITTVATFLERYLKIVMISKEEQMHIDFELGLKTKMPQGWLFNDDSFDVFARLRAGGVEWD